MSSFFRKPLSKTKLALIPIGGLAVGSLVRTSVESDVVQNNEHFKKISRTLTGTIRAAKLLSTVSVICADYGYVILKNRNKETEYDRLTNELIRIRNMHENVSMKRWKSVGTEQEAELTAQAEDLYRQINDLSQKCSTVESNFADTHHRSAVRLLALCEANGGVYIKLGQHLSQLDFLLPKEFITILRR